jgi:hypothetical protein
MAPFTERYISIGATEIRAANAAPALCITSQKTQDVPEKFKSRWSVNRPELDKIFTMSILRDKHNQNRKAPEAYSRFDR